MKDYTRFIELSKYARWLPDQQRRETWEESVDRYFRFFANRLPLADKVLDLTWSQYLGQLNGAVKRKEVMPSMRMMMTAGPALDRDNVAGYNCGYAAVGQGGNRIRLYTDAMEDAGFEEPITIYAYDVHAFDEFMYLLLCGVGVGFSVERQFIHNLPVVGHNLPRSIYYRNSKNYPGVHTDELSFFDKRSNIIRVSDSKYGWASALRILITELYNGNFNIEWDTSKVRPAGAVLKTFGGRASGPEPLIKLFNHVVRIFTNANGRKLTSIECHDLKCFIASSVVVGGVRRAALISLSNLSDLRMMNAKMGDWYNTNPQRAYSNNSVAFTEEPSVGQFMDFWNSVYNSKSGERGIFNRGAATKFAPRRDPGWAFGCNPCSEINLRSNQFCNLSEVVARPEDTFKDLQRKVAQATILGTIQSTVTDFVYIRPVWKEHCDEERLLGVSITGIMDNSLLNGKSYALQEHLEQLKIKAVYTNRLFSEVLGINQSAAVTCVKPSGTVSQLCNSSSGIHPRHSEYYIRTARADKNDPLAQFMIDQGFHHEDHITEPDTTLVFSFPIKAPSGAILTKDRTAIQQLEHWLTFQQYWCEHKPSCTINVKEHEWPTVGAWVWEHFSDISGVSFFPYDDNVYEQAPYQEIDQRKYNELYASMPKEVDWTKLADYEKEDHTEGMSEFACAGNSCELI